MSVVASGLAHGGGVIAVWQPPPRAWHQIWQTGTAEVLPYGLLSAASDFVWRAMWLSPTYMTCLDIERLTGCPRQQTWKMMQSMVRRGCAVRHQIGGAVKSHRVERQHRMERTTDYLDGDNSRVEYRPVVPQTPMARHLRQMQQQPTPAQPASLSPAEVRLWQVLADNAIGRAAVISMAACASLLSVRADTLRLIHRRLAARGIITRLFGCQMSVWRLTALDRPVPSLIDPPALSETEEMDGDDDG